MVGRVVGRYRILSPLGSGGSATVWRAEDTLLGRTVALKLLAGDLSRSSPTRRRFLHEARSLARIDHPAIAPVYDVGESDDDVYLALAFIDGVTVSEYATRGPLPASEIVRIGIAAAEAMAYAHGQGVIHRDVTGRNLMVARDGRVFVLDFGLARALGDSRITSSGVVMGTIEYLAPEVALGGTADARSDVYGLGAVLYEAATGARPHTGERREAVYWAAINRPTEAPRVRRPDLPVDLERVILHALEKDPTLRYADMESLAADLRRVTIEPAAEAPASRLRATEATDGAWLEVDAGFDIPRPAFLAILPFEPVAGDGSTIEELTRLAHGMSDAVGAALGGVEGVHVIPPALEASSDAAVGDVRRLARQLGANLLLRGSLRRAGVEVRVSYALVDPYRGVQVSAGTLRGDAGDWFGLEDQLVRAVLKALGEEEAARARTQGVRPDGTGHERYLLALGYLLRYDNEASVDGAIGLLKELVERVPESALFQAALARAYLRKFQLTSTLSWESQAARHCQKALALDGKLPEVRLTLAELHLAAGRHEEAAREFETLLHERPDWPPALMGLSAAAARSGRMAEAEDACRRAISQQPEYWGHYNELGKLLARQGRLEEAIEPWREVVRLAPDNPLGYCNVAGALYRLDRWEEALVMARRSVQVQPRPLVYTILGSTLFRLGRDEEAIETLRKGVELNPSDPTIWGNLGSALRWTPEREREAREPLERGIALMRARIDNDPDQVDDWIHLASWLANLGCLEEAREAADRALALPSLHGHAMSIAAVVFHLSGDRERCLFWLRQALQHGCRPGRLRTSRPLASLHADPEFLSLLDEAEGVVSGLEPHPKPEDHDERQGRSR